jgi:hypothetical protein
LNQKSHDILGVFVSTINGLKSVVQSAKDQIEVKNAEIEAAVAERDSLANVVSNNEQIISKLSEFTNL